MHAPKAPPHMPQVAGPPPRAPANGRPGFPFVGFLGAGGRLPKERRNGVGVFFLSCD